MHIATPKKMTVIFAFVTYGFIHINANANSAMYWLLAQKSYISSWVVGWGWFINAALAHSIHFAAYQHGGPTARIKQVRAKQKLSQQNHQHLATHRIQSKQIIKYRSNIKVHQHGTRPHHTLVKHIEFCGHIRIPWTDSSDGCQEGATCNLVSTNSRHLQPRLGKNKQQILLTTDQIILQLTEILHTNIIMEITDSVTSVSAALQKRTSKQIAEPWYWLCKRTGHCSHSVKDFTYLCRHILENWEHGIVFLCFLKTIHWSLLLARINFNPSMDKLLHSLYSEVKLLIHSQNSMVQPLKFVDG